MTRKTGLVLTVLASMTIVVAIAVGVVITRGGEHQPSAAEASHGTADSAQPTPPSRLRPADSAQPTPYQLKAGAGITLTVTNAEPNVSLETAQTTAQRATGETPTSGGLYQCQKLADTPVLNTPCWVIGLPVPAAITIAGGFQTPRPASATATFSTALVDADTGKLIVVITGTEPPSA